jgi:hypothetical protein
VKRTRFVLRCEVLTAVKMSVAVLCALTGSWQRCRGTYCLHLHSSRVRQYVLPDGFTLDCCAMKSGRSLPTF